MKFAHLLLIVLTVSVVCVAGCDKKVTLTVRNHSDISRTIQVSDPYETFQVGAVGANGGSLTTTLKVKNDDLPAQCGISAQGLATQNFTVTEDSPKNVWFHISSGGKMVGPMRENDVYTETEQTIDVETTVDQKTLVR